MTNAEAIKTIGEFLSHGGKLIYKTSKMKKTKKVKK
jgi:hypothetical protein